MNSHRARALLRRGQGTNAWERPPELEERLSTPAVLLTTGSSSEVKGPLVQHSLKSSVPLCQALQPVDSGVKPDTVAVCYYRFKKKPDNLY